jgi:hypothetical protein
MRLLWKIIKVGIVLAIGLPLAFIVLATSMGILGAVMGLAFLVLRVAVICAVLWLVVRFAISLFTGKSESSKTVYKAEPLKPLAPVDPHYEAALRELDKEFSADGPRSR